MKKTLIAFALLAAGFAFGGVGSAYAYTTYGSVDELHSSTDSVASYGNCGNGTCLQNEIDWAADMLNDPTFTFTYKDETPSWITVDAVNKVYAFDFGASSAPSYFLLKLGKGEITADGSVDALVYYLYKNLDNMRYGVIDLDASFGDGVVLKGVGSISHVDQGVGAVPLPGSAWLFGSALLGFMAVANRRRV